MADQAIEAKEKTVMKMSWDGLYEEALNSGASRRISRRAKENEIVREEAESPERLHSSRRTPYADSDMESRSAASPPDRTQRRQQAAYAGRIREGWANSLESGSREGGEKYREQSTENTGDLGTHQRRLRSSQLQKAESDETGGSREKEMLPEKDSGDERTEEAEETVISEHASRMGGVKDHSAKLSEEPLKSVAELHHTRSKKQTQKFSQEQKRRALRLEEAAPDTAFFSERKEEIIKRQKKERYNQEQRKQAAGSGARQTGRLRFDSEESMVRGSGTGFGKASGEVLGAAAGALAMAAHSKLHEAEEDNSGVEAAHSAERLAEEAVRQVSDGRITRNSVDAGNRHRLLFGEEPAKTATAAKQEADKTTIRKKALQKQRYRKMYAAAKREEKTTEQAYRMSQNLVTKAVAVVRETVRRNSKVLLAVGILGLMLFLMASSVASCTAVIHGTGSSIVATTYASTDTQIHRVENEYRRLEASLSAQLHSISARYPDYDEYRYQIDEISHNPYHLISYFTVKYGEFTYSQVRAELEEIFREQYAIHTESDTITTTHTKQVRVGESLGRVVTSGYCSCPICCGQWSGGPTASGVYPTANHTIAVDANNPTVPLGTRVIMNGVEYVVEDTGAFARYGVDFDVYYDNHANALAHGHQVWEAYLADSNGSTVIQVTTTETVERLSVTLTNRNLDAVLRSRMTADEIKRYEVYNKTYGNRNYLFDLSSLPQYGPYDSYTVPLEALSDERFARMIREAEKYLGYPYVWGGSSPSTSFDCSGFVSWVVNNCGNGWNYGRLTAEGLRQVCAYVSPEAAKPGDLIFFQGTYDCYGASHCGIYVGDGMMIHCGNPIQYTSINASYWQEHFYQFGRLS